jgi:hypothetical protein
MRMVLPKLRSICEPHFNLRLRLGPGWGDNVGNIVVGYILLNTDGSPGMSCFKPKDIATNKNWKTKSVEALSDLSRSYTSAALSISKMIMY